MVGGYLGARGPVGDPVSDGSYKDGGWPAIESKELRRWRRNSRGRLASVGGSFPSGNPVRIL